MSNFSNDLSDRFLMLAVNIMKFEMKLCKSYSGRHIYGQLFRSCTSAGANFEEARAGESSADFIHKLQIVLKELRESHFWIKLIIFAKLNLYDEEVLQFIFHETKELSCITAKSVITAKSKIKKPKPTIE